MKRSDWFFLSAVLLAVLLCYALLYVQGLQCALPESIQESPDRYYWNFAPW